MLPGILKVRFQGVKGTKPGFSTWLDYRRLIRGNVKNLNGLSNIINTTIIDTRHNEKEWTWMKQLKS